MTQQLDSLALSVSRGFSQLHLKLQDLESEIHDLKGRLARLESKGQEWKN